MEQDQSNNPQQDSQVENKPELKKSGLFLHKLHDDENLLALYRRSDMTFMPTVLEVFVLIFIPWYFALKYNIFSVSKIYSDIMILWTLVVFFFALRRFMFWYLDYYMLTSDRLLHIYHQGIFKKIVNETYLDRVLNVSFKTTGFASTLFGYGDVSVQAVGMQDHMEMKSVSNPEHIKESIWVMHLKKGGASHFVYTPKIAQPKDEGDDSEDEKEE